MASYEPRLAARPPQEAPAMAPQAPPYDPGLGGEEDLNKSAILGALVLGLLKRKKKAAAVARPAAARPTTVQPAAAPRKKKRGFFKKVARGAGKVAKKGAKGVKRAAKAVVKAHVDVAKLSAKGTLKLASAIAKAAAAPIRLAARPIILRRAKFLSYQNRKSTQPNSGERKQASAWFISKLAAKGPLGKLGALILKKTGTGVSGIYHDAAVLGAVASQKQLHPYDVALIMALREWHDKTHRAKKPLTLQQYNKKYAGVHGVYATWASRGGPVIADGEPMMLGLTGAEIASVAASVAAIIAGLGKMLNRPGEAPADPTSGTLDIESPEQPPPGIDEEPAQEAAPDPQEDSADSSAEED